MILRTFSAKAHGLRLRFESHRHPEDRRLPPWHDGLEQGQGPQEGRLPGILLEVPAEAFRSRFGELSSWILFIITINVIAKHFWIVFCVQPFKIVKARQTTSINVPHSRILEFPQDSSTWLQRKWCNTQTNNFFCLDTKVCSTLCVKIVLSLQLIGPKKVLERKTENISVHVNSIHALTSCMNSRHQLCESAKLRFFPVLPTISSS